jgi:uncharacterized membrane protein YadS
VKESQVIAIHAISYSYASHRNNVFVEYLPIRFHETHMNPETVALTPPPSAPAGTDLALASPAKARLGPAAAFPLAARQSLRLGAFLVLVVLLALWASPPLALVAGAVFAWCLGRPLARRGPQLAKYLLQCCVVLLGFGMSLPALLRAGLAGSVFAAFTISATLLLGYWLGRVLKIERNVSALISAGTAICGGSAIAAVSSVLLVSEAETAVALGTVFLLNAVALYLFPLVGHALHLGGHQFGVWAGVAIHDISSVVGASAVYGPEALDTATAVKLSRSLWIVPITLAMAFTLGRRQRRLPPASTDAAAGPARSRKLRVEVPWFIGATPKKAAASQHRRGGRAGPLPETPGRGALVYRPVSAGVGAAELLPGRRGVVPDDLRHRADGPDPGALPDRGQPVRRRIAHRQLAARLAGHPALGVHQRHVAADGSGHKVRVLNPAPPPALPRKKPFQLKRRAGQSPKTRAGRLPSLRGSG